MIKRLTIIILVAFLSLSVKAQQQNTILSQTKTSTYSVVNKNFVVYSFSASNPIPTLLEQQMKTELLNKEGIKSMNYNTATNIISITTLANIKIDELNVVLNPLSIILIDKDTTPKEIIDKYATQTSTN